MLQGFPQMHNNQSYAKFIATPSMSSWSSPFPHLHSPDDVSPSYLLLKCAVGASVRRKKFLSWDRQTSLCASCCLCGWWQVCFLSRSWVRIRGTGAESWGWSLDSVGPCIQWGGSGFFPPLPLQILGRWFSACEIKIRQNSGSSNSKNALKGGKNLYVFTSNDSSCIFVLVTVSTGYIRHLHRISLMHFF